MRRRAGEDSQAQQAPGTLSLKVKMVQVPESLNKIKLLQVMAVLVEAPLLAAAEVEVLPVFPEAMERMEEHLVAVVAVVAVLAPAPPAAQAAPAAS